MSLEISWARPSTYLATETYTIKVYRSTSTESGDYTEIGTATNGKATNFTDPGGARNYFYYVRYFDSSNTQGSIILAIVDPTIRELRLSQEVNEVLPNIVKSNMDTNMRQARISIQQALNAINLASPTTSYTIDSMPRSYEVAVKLGAQIFVYSEQYLGIAIKDFASSEGGISLTKDRGSRISNAIDKVLNYYNQLLKQLKLGEWPAEPVGLGSLAMSSPRGRVIGMLYNVSS